MAIKSCECPCKKVITLVVFLIFINQFYSKMIKRKDKFKTDDESMNLNQLSYFLLKHWKLKISMCEIKSIHSYSLWTFVVSQFPPRCVISRNNVMLKYLGITGIVYLWISHLGCIQTQYSLIPRLHFYFPPASHLFPLRFYFPPPSRFLNHPHLKLQSVLKK